MSSLNKIFVIQDYFYKVKKTFRKPQLRSEIGGAAEF